MEKYVKRYSVKDNLALLLMSAEMCKSKDLDKLMASLDILLKQDKESVRNKVDKSLLDKMENSWLLKKSQVVAYCYLVFNHFAISDEALTAKNIVNNFIFQMKFYSPDNAVEFVEVRFNLKLD